MKRCFALMITLTLCIPTRGVAQDAGPMKIGDLVRISCVNADGLPTQTVVWSTDADAQESIIAFDAALSKRRPVSLEGMVSIGHNTLCHIEELRELSVNGNAVPIARVRLAEGTLAKTPFWVTLRRLRFRSDPDPAMRFAGRSLYEMSWDADYVPRTDDQIFLAGRLAGSLEPRRAMLWPSEAPARALAMPSDQPTPEIDSILCSPGTKAKVIETKLARESAGQLGFDYARVQIMTGPFEGLRAWTLSLNLARPSVYEKMVAAPASRDIK